MRYRLSVPVEGAAVPWVSVLVDSLEVVAMDVVWEQGDDAAAWLNGHGVVVTLAPDAESNQEGG